MTHHAYLLVGSPAWAYAHAGFVDDSSPDPDVIRCTYNRMTVADARSLIQDSFRRPIHDEFRRFFVSANVLLPDAQHSLLKLFEEPNAHTLFYLNVPHEDSLIPTLRSRLHLLGTESPLIQEDDFREFRALSVKDRLTRIGEKRTLEDDAWVQDVVSGYEAYAHQSKQPERMRDALLISTYMPTVGSAKKMLLEHIALSL